MANTTVLRVEVVGVLEGENGSLSANKKGITTSIAAGAVGATVASLPTVEIREDVIKRFRKEMREADKERGMSAKELRTKYRILNRDFPYKSSINKNKIISIKQGAAMASGAASLYSIYGNYQKIGHELSGATHAAQVQSRKINIANTGIQIGVAAMINPLLAAPMIAMKAYQLSQTNRKELFAIQIEQMKSVVLQRNLVKNVAERRF